MTYTQENCFSAILRLAFALFIGTGCSDVSPVTAPLTSTALTPRFIENSEHFYAGSDGYYYWDGQPPPGDLSPAVVTAAHAGGRAPGPGTQGWVEGFMTFIGGDQAKLDLNYSVDSSGHPIWNNAVASSGWQWFEYVDRNSSREYSFKQSLPQRYAQDPVTLAPCDFSLRVGGTGYARKAFPFAIVPSLIKFLVDVTFGITAWGEGSRPLDAFTDEGMSCDYPNAGSECDKPSTPQVEYCPVDGDPAHSPYNGGGGPTDVRGDYGGYSSPGGWVGGAQYCVDWIDWWVSFDGGTTWQYDYRECTQYEQM